MTNIDISPEAVERIRIEMRIGHCSTVGAERMILALSAALTESRAETAAAYERAARICENRNDEIWDRDTGEKVGLDGAAEKIRALTPADAIAARDRMIADAEARGMREVAAIAEKGVEILGLRMREAKDKKEKLNWQSMLFCAVDIKQAIIAAIPKGGDA